MSNYSRKVVGETKHRLESIHGKGLVGLYDENGRFQQQHLSKDKHLKNTTWIESGGITFDSSSNLAWVLGIVDGIEFDLLASGQVDT